MRILAFLHAPDEKITSSPSYSPKSQVFRPLSFAKTDTLTSPYPIFSKSSSVNSLSSCCSIEFFLVHFLGIIGLFLWGLLPHWLWCRVI
jgi:hypothetical protein